MDVKVTVVRHPRENLKKCSLSHLHGEPSFEFLTASDGFSFDASGFTLLEMDAPAITEADADRPFLLLDSTWNLLGRIRRKVYGNFAPRSIPPAVLSAYPRVSKMHDDPCGLATVEALYAALRLMGKADVRIMKNYKFAQHFLEINGWSSDAPEGFFDGTGQIFASNAKNIFEVEKLRKCPNI